MNTFSTLRRSAPNSDDVRRSARRARAARAKGCRPAMERLEPRINLDAALYAGGLEFLAVGASSWDGRDTQNEVRIGLDRRGSGAEFGPLVDVSGGFALNTTGNPTATTDTGSKVTTYSADNSKEEPLFDGTETLSVSDGALEPTGGDIASEISLAGQTMPLASLDLSGSTVSLSVGGGASATVAGGTFTFGGATAGYDLADGSFFVYGSGTFAWGTDNLTVQLGDATVPGLVFRGGELSSAHGSASGQLTVGGLDFTITDLGLDYQAADRSNPAEYALAGQATLDWAAGGAPADRGQPWVGGRSGARHPGRQRGLARRDDHHEPDGP